MADYRLEENYMGGKRLRLKDFDEYGILLNGHVDGFVYEDKVGFSIISVPAVIGGKTRVSDLTDAELVDLLNYCYKHKKGTVSVIFEKAVQLRELERRLLEEGVITRGAA